MKCETVRIQGADGAIVINKSDFDESKHKLFKEQPSKPAKKAKAK